MFVLNMDRLFRNSANQPHCRHGTVRGAVWIDFGTVGTIFSYYTATMGQPLCDIKFEAWDAMLGFHWKTWWDAVFAHPLLTFIFAVCYSSFPVQICLAIIYFSHKQVPDRNRELLWIAILSGVIVSLISGFLPASGAFEYFGVPEFASHLLVLTALRESGAHSFQLGKTEGIVTFPSYHTIMAIYFIYIFRGYPFLFCTISTINGVIILSVFTHGGHYLVDVISGAFVAISTICTVRYFSARFAPEN